MSRGTSGLGLGEGLRGCKEGWGRIGYIFFRRGWMGWSSGG
jgi:hypothetical protein